MSADLTDLRARCADLESGIAAATTKLRHALLSGADTSEMRDFMTALQSQLTAARAAFDAMMASITDHQEQQIATEAKALAAASGRRLMVLLESLKPPPSPAVN